VPVHAVDDLPAVGLEALGRVVGKPAIDFAIDRDVEADELAELQGARQRTGLVGNAFHQAAITQEYPGFVVDDLVTRAVELGGEHLFGHCKANGVGDALSKRTRGCLDGTARFVFRMSGCPEAQLAEVPDLLDWEIFITGQMQQTV
jgi:hypothetical protein